MGQGALTPGEPVGALRDARLWMVYLHHRYAIESALKYVGGLYQNIVVKGDTLPPTEFIPVKVQRDVARPAARRDRAGQHDAARKPAGAADARPGQQP